MDTPLTYMKKALQYERQEIVLEGTPIRIALITNFTDDQLKKILTGICVTEGVAIKIYTTPFQQYAFELKDKDSALWRFDADATFIFFDVNEYQTSAFAMTPEHFYEVFEDIKYYGQNTRGILVLHTFPPPESRQYGRMFKGRPLVMALRQWNASLEAFAEETNNVFLIDTVRLLRQNGGITSRDFRGMYAFSQPFTTDFLLRIAEEWYSYIRTMSGRLKKCLVLDLDNTLWGGVLGEVGLSGIQLGHEYPGNAFLEFQRTLLNFYENGVILAINSRNNYDDVIEMLREHPHMILREEHFAVIVANWNDKATNLRLIAEELNIGLDGIVFIDDDPMNRSLVSEQLPEVFVPPFSLPPEDYTRTLLNLDIFHGLTQSDEDRERGRMYAEERKRKEFKKNTLSLDEYIASLNIQLVVEMNNNEQVTRFAQLTQKTNQYNLTTYRMTVAEVDDAIKRGCLVYSGDISDRFGSYGITLLGIIEPVSNTIADLSVFLMSCRVVGRRVEDAFFTTLVRDLVVRGYTELTCRFIPTNKNMPVKDFLRTKGLININEYEGGGYQGSIDLKEYLEKERIQESYVTIIQKLS